MPTIWLIRHAESETNAGQSTAMPGTAALTPRGFEQARRIAQAFPRHPELIITSPYLRAKQTAAPTLRRFPDARYEEWPVHEFTYLARSLGEGRTTLHERRGMVEAYWKRLDHSYQDGEGAESFTQFFARVQSVVEQLRYAEEACIAVFSHGQFILAILSWLMQLIFDNMQQFRYFLLANDIPNGAMIQISLQMTGEVRFSPFLTSHLLEGEPSHTRDSLQYQP